MIDEKRIEDLHIGTETEDLKDLILRDGPEYGAEEYTGNYRKEERSCGCGKKGIQFLERKNDDEK